MTNTTEDAADFLAWQLQTLAKLEELEMALEAYSVAVQATTVEDWLTTDLPEIPNILVEVL